MKWTSQKLHAAAKDYVAAFYEACALTKVDKPLDALINTDAYPRLQKTPVIEFAIGWLHGCAEALGVTVEQLVEEVKAELVATRARALKAKAA